MSKAIMMHYFTMLSFVCISFKCRGYNLEQVIALLEIHCI